MIQLSGNKYGLLLEPLKQVDFNTMYIHSVLAGHIGGRVYVDCEESPKSFYVVHDYGMSLLFGEAGNERFNDALLEYFLENNGTMARDEQVQIYPSGWNVLLEKVVDAGKAKRDMRLNFSFDKELFMKNNAMPLDEYAIVPTAVEMFRNIEGLVIPKEFWRDEREFMQNAASYTVVVDGEPASTAFAAYRHDDKLEIGIETMEKFRGAGLARIVCIALINYCLENNLEPMWSCRLENTGSVSLAGKLGFVESRRMPYYRVLV